ncbi:sphingomyelin synthase-related protein 1-like [Oppia nitens]|uniref:sphingomyelin synthase-related protein 1-like n=1 Tax=Oppia nitens TaxID=1686743 RepID=UPI0023DC1FC9|nr:sphingomyelin synthase-related protein 1-like [Oppia nitens]
MNLMDKPVNKWSAEDVGNWLSTNGFQRYVQQFRDDHQIDGICLLTLTEDDLRSPPLLIQVLGDIKRLGIALRSLQEANTELVLSVISRPQILSSLDKTYMWLKQRQLIDSNSDHSPNHNHHHHNHHHFPLTADRLLLTTEPELVEIKPESWKALIAMIYFFAATWITAIIMVIVHDRVPDMQTYPPLPDIFLDNIPLIPHAFDMCEVCGLVLFITWIVVLIFHKHRFVLLRRMFSLFGSVFFLRCVTMLITSLSVPGRHLQCKARPYGSWLERLHQAFVIWQGGGMSIQGVRTCGDYMFSGHTVVITLLNFFITEYTPPTLYLVHTLSWVFNLFGIFFILAAHEHYSIDVFIAFYISTRLFLYYHSLANNQALYQNDRKRTRIWFPLFYFFESGVQDIVPNVYDNPFVSRRNWNYNPSSVCLFFKKLLPNNIFTKNSEKQL